MKLDLMPLPFSQAIEIIDWCYMRGIDLSKCGQLKAAIKSKDNSIHAVEWSLEIPDRYITWFNIKWNL